MKKIFVYAAAAALAMTAISCQKESLNEDVNISNDGLVFTASIDAGMDTKTTLTSEKKVNWEATDEITINGVVYTAAPKSDATKADFTKKDTKDDPSGTYNAFYPKGIQTEATAGGTLPAEQTYAAGKITNVPMFATSTTTSLFFKNICAVLAVTVKSADFPSVKSIKVSSSNCALSGAFTVSDGQKAVLTEATTVANTVTLNCGTTAVATASEGTVFYIAIPAQTYRNLKIELSSDGNSYTKAMTTKKDADIAVAVNTVYPITFKADAGVLLPGKFSVSSEKQVQFTKGNLWWNGSDWKIESNQTAYPTTWSTSHVSHLFWTKTAAASYADTYNVTDYDCSDKFFADGSDANHMLTVDGQSDLYVLSNAEWTYLINSRTSGLYKCGVTVSNGGTNYTNCLIIAPDDFTGTLQTSYTLDEVNASGLVCLPAAGNRNGSGLENGGSSGNYWSATPHENTKKAAYYLGFDGSNVNPSEGNYRSRGRSVRLVCSAAPSAPVYPEAPGLACVKIGDVWWAPVNCGYDATHTYGSLYQWGRKYGQYFEAGTLALTDMNKADDTEANKGKFGKYNSTNYNWYNDVAMDNTLWSESGKGGSDPCPEGWRVPTEAEFGALISQKAWGKSTVGTVEQSGFWFNGSSAASVGTGVFLPAAGFRNYNNGNTSNRGSNGVYWSSSVNGNLGRRLYFIPNDDDPSMSSIYRAYGYSVRCVQE